MARRRPDDDEWDGAEDDGDAFADDDDDAETIPCPFCQRPIYAGSERCPHCEHYISAEDAPAARKPWWIVIGVILSLVVVYLLIRYY